MIVLANFCSLFFFDPGIFSSMCNITWCVVFVIPGIFMLNDLTHSKIETMLWVCSGLWVPHYFTLPYSPWYNWAVDRPGEASLKIFFSIWSEHQMNQNKWPELVPILKTVLNNSPSRQRGDFAPMPTFTVGARLGPFNTFTWNAISHPVSLKTVNWERKMRSNDLKRSWRSFSLLNKLLSIQTENINEIHWLEKRYTNWCMQSFYFLLPMSFHRRIIFYWDGADRTEWEKLFWTMSVTWKIF